MAITPVPPMSDTPPFPALADRATGDYNSKAYAFGTHMADTFNDELLAVADSVEANATDAAASASAAADQVSLATTQANNAANSAAAAATTAGASAWVSGATYGLNTNAISQIDFQTYRKKTASSVSTVDPSTDPENWKLISSAGPSLPSSLAIIRTAGVITSVTNTINGLPEVTTITRTGGVITQVVITYNGKTRTETYAYANGVLTGMTAVES